MENNQSAELKKLFKYSIIFVAIISIFFVVKIFTELKEARYIGYGLYPQNTVTLTGYGEVFAVPDTATFSFSVINEAKTAEMAQKTVTEKMNAIIDALKKEGILEKDIKTTSYNLYPKYESKPVYQGEFYPYPRYDQVLTGYELNHSISVKVAEAEKAGKILELVGGMGVNNLSSISFTVGDKDVFVREARQIAIKDAELKAKQLSKDLGVKVARVVNFYEDGPMFPFPGGYGGDMDMKMIGVEMAIPEIPVGENRITSQVHITYEIR